MYSYNPDGIRINYVCTPQYPSDCVIKQYHRSFRDRVFVVEKQCDRSFRTAESEQLLVLWKAKISVCLRYH